MVGLFQPVPSNIKIVKPDGTPTDYFIRWTEARGIDINGAISQEILQAALAELNLADLADVADTSPTDGQYLKWVAANSRWEPATVASGGGGGGFGRGVECTLDGSGGMGPTLDLSAGQTVAWDGVDTFDTDGYHDPAVNNTRITSNAADTWVQLKAQILFDQLSSTTTRGQIRISSSVAGAIATSTSAPGTGGFQWVQVYTGPFLLTDPGTEYFEVAVSVAGDTTTRYRRDGGRGNAHFQYWTM